MKQQEENENQNSCQNRNTKVEKKLNTDCYSEKEKLDEIDELLYSYFKQNREIPESTSKVIETTLYTEKSTKTKSTKNMHKFRFILSKVAIFILSISVIGTGVAFASDISDFFKNLFGLNDVGINNASVVSAIENNYVQNVDMDYIKINDEYSIKIDYLMMDDINLYTVFNMYSDNGFDTNYRISILDLKILADDEVIFDNASREDTSINIVSGWNEIKQEERNSKRELLFLMSDKFPSPKKLEYTFSKIILYDKNLPSEKTIEIMNDGDITIQIDVVEKFKNRDILDFKITDSSEIYKIDRFISNNTGTYLVFETEKPEIKFDLIYDNNVYEGTKRIINVNESKYLFIVQYNIVKDDIKNKGELKLKDYLNTEINIT